MLVDGLSVTLRALSFLAMFQAAGTAFFIALFRHEVRVNDLALRRLGAFAALGGLTLVLAHHALEAGRAAGELAGVMDPALQGLVLRSAAGTALSWRLLGLLLMLLSFRRHGTRATLLGVIGAVIMLAGFAFVGHTATAPERWLLSPMLLVHLLVAAFWFGALLPLWRISAQEPAAAAGQVVVEFSALAIWLVPALLVAGLVLAVGLLPGVSALGTPYGRLLTVKVTGFAVLMLLAALNKWRLGPALKRGESGAGHSFCRSLAVEYLLIGTVLCVTAALTTFYSPDD
jgi:putative copper resistance protein D